MSRTRSSMSTVEVLDTEDEVLDAEVLDVDDEAMTDVGNLSRTKDIVFDIEEGRFQGRRPRV